MISSALPAIFLAAETPAPVGYDDISQILSTVTSQFSVSNIVAMIAGVLGVTVAFVFLWWGVRKGFKAITKAATKGKPTI